MILIRKLTAHLITGLCVFNIHISTIHAEPKRMPVTVAKEGYSSDTAREMHKQFSVPAVLAAGHVGHRAGAGRSGHSRAAIEKTGGGSPQPAGSPDRWRCVADSEYT